MVSIVCRSAPRTDDAGLPRRRVVRGTPRHLPPGYCGEEVRVRQAMNTHDSDQEPARGWSGRFSEPVAELVKLYTASIDFDQRLADADITASIAHARMLGATGVLTSSDVASIERGMQQIRGEIERGELEWSRDLEDVHQNL